MTHHTNGHRHTLSASTLNGTKVENRTGDNLGNIEDIMLDLDTGRVAYAVLSFGGFMGMGDKLFAVPWSALNVDTAHEKIIFDVSKDKLKDAPGFDKSHWPDMADREWATKIHRYYNQEPYWQRTY